MSGVDDGSGYSAFDDYDVQGDFNEDEPSEFTPLAMLQDSDWETIRAWVGPGPSDDEIAGRFDRFQDIDKVIEETLRNKLSILLEQPASIGLNDGTTMSTDANINGLRELLRSFIARGGSRSTEHVVPGTVQIVKIARSKRHTRR